VATFVQEMNVPVYTALHLGISYNKRVQLGKHLASF